MFFSERGVPAPEKLLATSLFQDDLIPQCMNVARAIAANDNAQLAVALEEAEAHHLIVHAARMRIVLAQRTGDRTQLTRARSVLEPLQDRHFLRRLEEVQALVS
jgi:hypothetical protein